ncbi:hypothetical protein [Paraburkholderia tropica]|uniref:hypothetical protein n=1 Tax=Paraburkholderia tropica TaxID=92647 RepID=UPI003D2A9EEC
MALPQTPQYKRLATILKSGKLFQAGSLAKFHDSLVESVRKYRLQELFLTELEMYPLDSPKHKNYQRAAQLFHLTIAAVVSEMGNAQMFGEDSQDLSACTYGLINAVGISGYPIPTSIMLATIATVQPDVPFSTLTDILSHVNVQDDFEYNNLITVLEQGNNTAFLDHVKTVRQAHVEKTHLEATVPSTDKTTTQKI